MNTEVVSMKCPSCLQTVDELYKVASISLSPNVNGQILVYVSHLCQIQRMIHQFSLHGADMNFKAMIDLSIRTGFCRDCPLTQ
jgi:hypothetical protein